MIEPPVGARVTGVPKPLPGRVAIDGRSVRLEPLEVGHAEDLWTAAQGSNTSWAYMGYGPFSTFEEFKELVATFSTSEDPLFWAVIPRSSRKATGWLTLMDIQPANGAIELGNIWFAPPLQRTRASTEAMFLLMSLAMDTLEYLRLVWKCNSLNAPSRRAAERLGYVFEGVLRAHLVVKQRRRDTAYFSILQDEWPARRAAISAWLEDANFDEQGKALSSLSR